MRLSKQDAFRVGDILSQAAEAEIIPRFRTLVADQVREKSSAFDIVTEADEAAEQLIANGLKAAFPTAAIIGEEAAAKDQTLFEKIATAELAFIIDPIDGTKNFVWLAYNVSQRRALDKAAVLSWWRCGRGAGSGS